jgi:hypothetical protein
MVGGDGGSPYKAVGDILYTNIILYLNVIKLRRSIAVQAQGCLPGAENECVQR